MILDRKKEKKKRFHPKVHSITASYHIASIPHPPSPSPWQMVCVLSQQSRCQEIIGIGFILRVVLDWTKQTAFTTTDNSSSD